MGCAMGRKGATVLGLVALAALALACTDTDPNGTKNCNGAKCDDPGGTPTAHATAVLRCDGELEQALVEAGDATPLAVKAQQVFRDCVTTADNGAVVAIEDNLVQLGSPLRSREEIVIVFDEFRYASLCVDLESASAARGDDLELLVTTCEARRERSLAEAIGALVDFGEQGTGWSLLEERETFSECYREYDAQLAESESASEDYAARQELVDCAAARLRAQALPLKEARCAQEECSDELLVLSFVEAGFETAIATSDRACQLLIDSSVYGRDDGGEPLLDCRMTAYAELANQITKGLQQ